MSQAEEMLYILFFMGLSNFFGRATGLHTRGNITISTLDYVADLCYVGKY